MFENLPFVATDEELDEVKRNNPSMDPYYIASGCCRERRARFEALWPKFEPYADSNFLSELKKHFHQRTWEMYLCNVLLQKGLSLSYHRINNPDFIVKYNSANDSLYIECTAITKGISTNPDGVPELTYGEFVDVPENEILLRITQVIKEKSRQYCRWYNSGSIDPDIPYIIAINTGEIGRFDNPYMPYVLKALFGITYQYVCINPTESRPNNVWGSRESIQRSCGGEVAVNAFCNDALSHISGILFSDRMVLSHPNILGADCHIVNNPFAKISLSTEFINLFNSWNVTGTTLTYTKRTI